MSSPRSAPEAGERSGTFPESVNACPFRLPFASTETAPARSVAREVTVSKNSDPFQPAGSLMRRISDIRQLQVPDQRRRQHPLHRVGDAPAERFLRRLGWASMITRRLERSSAVRSRRPRSAASSEKDMRSVPTGAVGAGAPVAAEAGRDALHGDVDGPSEGHVDAAVHDDGLAQIGRQQVRRHPAPRLLERGKV